ncbi:hypothetical protein [Magnetofaba australis]|uniref:Uncharacterized protein n=1 Tax=Magnetofaba australis IT-1 TaxID=1434232 RepID=A0A1Y2K9Q8_9PROT|nr:hypothetical protein [Magnetofaba australis]OSM07684.1 hypothetical protein MAIT1_04548 [Magnetofaba australis IT-1]
MNTPLLALTAMCAEQVAAMETLELAELESAVEVQAQEIKRIKTLLDQAKQLKFGARADAVRRDQGKPTGIVRFEDGHFVIVNDMPKKPEWDQEKLAAIAEEIRRDGVDPGHYLDTVYKVQERRYTAWPPHIQQAFAAARILKVGKPSFRIEIKGGA